MFTDKLIEIRKEITQKFKEINELENEKEELWKKVLREINDNKARYRKIEGLSGLKSATLEEYTGERVIIIYFDKNSFPSATALSNIESDTGLRFLFSDKDRYAFGL